MDDCCESKAGALDKLAFRVVQRRILKIVLTLNATMFLVEFTAGVVAGSASLMADAVDMLGDAVVYALSLYALNRGERWKAGAAVAKGGLILVFGAGVLGEVAVKMATGVPPSSKLMMTFGGLALLVNLACLSLLRRFRDHDVNMSSTFECSRNDVLANCGVLVAAAGVALVNAPWPDLVVGLLVAALFLQSALRVLARSLPLLRSSPAVGSQTLPLSPE